ncbi:MAG TPA: translocation/assembly module TamB domain-containing protein [Terriglobales bacterium]|nr:translocation/assembly module TamB domain-containing protein [Terriglobales bacterium]
MTDGKTNPRRNRLWIQAALGLLLLGAFVATGWYFTSPQFNRWVRNKVIADVERATGGRVDIGQLRWTLWKLEFEARDVTVHGLEPPGEIPYLHVDRINLRAKVMSALKRQVGLRFLELDRPVFHLIINPDGSTNQPVPRKRSSQSPIETLFDLATDEIRVSRGEVRINDRPVPIDFAASDVAAAMSYDSGGPRYHGSLHVGKIDTKFKDMRPFSAVADAQFVLAGHTFHVTSLTMKSGDSHLVASGYIQDLSSAAVDVNYRATLDLRNVGAISRTRQMRHGVLHLDGRGTYTQSAFNSIGRLTVSGLDWQEPSVRIRNVSLASDYRVDNLRLLLPNISAAIFGGRATGKVEVLNWLSQQTASRMLAANPRPQQQVRQGSAIFQISGVGLSGIVGAISTPSLPLDRVNMVGATSGSIAATWTGELSKAVAELDLAIVPPANTTPQQVPVTGTVQGRYLGSSGVLRIASAELSTPATRVEAGGSLGSTAAALRITATTSNLGELTPIFAAQGHSASLPVDLHGQATFDGTVGGRISAPTIAGHLQITDFESLIAPPAMLGRGQKAPVGKTVASEMSASNPRTVRRMHWDIFSTDLHYSPSSLALRNSALRRGNAQINFDLNAQLHRGRFTETSPFTAHVNAHRAQVADLQTLAGYDYPLSGIADVNVRVSGTQSTLRGNGHVVVSSAVVHGHPVDRASADVDFANGEAQFNNIIVAQKRARVLGAAAYNITTHGFRFRLRGNNFNLADIPVLQQGRLKHAGLMSFEADGSGTPDAPIINANVSVTNFVVNGERAGDITAQARTVGETLTLSARSNVGDSDLTVNGTVRLRDDFPAAISIRFAHLDFDPLVQAYLRGRMTGDSSLAGAIDMRGPLRRLRDLQVQGELSQIYVPIENIQVRNHGPIRFAISQQVLQLKELHLLAEGTDFTATGMAELSGERRLDLVALGHVNLKIVQTLNPDYVSYGNLSMDVKVNGTVANPLVNGHVQVANAGISYIDLPNGLSDINGDLVFNRDRLQIQNMTARTGGGTLNLTGYVTYARTIGFNIQAFAKDIRLRYPPGVSSMADANVRLSGTLRNSTLTGDVTITRFGLNPRFDFAQYLARSKQPPELTDPDSPLTNLRLDLHVTSTPELQVQTSLARLSGNVDLRLRGTAARPTVLGRVDIIDGDVFFNGTKYHVERGDITFTNPTRVEPVLDIEASTRVRNYDITLGFHGPTEKLSTTYRSDPPLATADIIALLAFGRTREESAMQPVSSQNFTETASNAILGQALNATVSSRVQKLFGVSRIKIDPQVGGAENNPSGARVTIEQQVANNLTITYITDLARSNQQIISVEYNVTRAVSILAVRDQNGIVSFDVRIRHRKR